MKEMNKKKNPKKNQYQILVIICALCAIVYGYIFYVACKLHNPAKMWFNGLIAAAWAFCAVVWLLQLKKIKNEGEKQ